MSAEKVLEFAPHKTCAKCGESKPHSEYHKHSQVGLRPRCKICRKIDAARPWPDKRKTVILNENGRTCLDCKQEKSWKEFARDEYGYNRKTANCKECRNIKGRQYIKEHPEIPAMYSSLENRPTVLKRKYGVTWEYVVQTLANQFGRCANLGCSKEISLEVKGIKQNRAVIDHCHTTGKFRALLCIECNTILGTLENKNTKILGLMDYINKHK